MQKGVQNTFIDELIQMLTAGRQGTHFLSRTSMSETRHTGTQANTPLMCWICVQAAFRCQIWQWKQKTAWFLLPVLWCCKHLLHFKQITTAPFTQQPLKAQAGVVRYSSFICDAILGQFHWSLQITTVYITSGTRSQNMFPHFLLLLNKKLYSTDDTQTQQDFYKANFLCL